MACVIDKLFQVPKKEKGVEQAHFQKYKPNMFQQADLLFLPSDAGFKYLLTCVDVGSHFIDMEPLKDKSNSTIVKAFRKIYQRNILDLPKVICFDSGSEFKGTVAKWFIDQGIRVTVAKPGRHRQQAMIERNNQIIGKELFKNMLEEEVATGIPNSEWTDDIADVKEKINLRAEERQDELPEDEYSFTKWSGKVWAIGTKVRVALDGPIDQVTKKPLIGKFRSHDIRWNLKPRTIKQVIIEPYQPPLYLLDTDDGDTDRTIAYTKGQLQKITKNEIKPVPKQRNKLREYYQIDKIVDDKKENGKVFYKVRWHGYKSDEDT